MRPQLIQFSGVGISELVVILALSLLYVGVSLASSTVNFHMTINPPPPPALQAIVTDTNTQQGIVLGTTDLGQAIVVLHNLSTSVSREVVASSDGHFGILVDPEFLPVGNNDLAVGLVHNSIQLSDASTPISVAIDEAFHVSSTSAPSGVRIGAADETTKRLMFEMVAARTQVAQQHEATVLQARSELRFSILLNFMLLIVLTVACTLLLYRRHLRKLGEGKSSFSVGRGIYMLPPRKTA